MKPRLPNTQLRSPETQPRQSDYNIKVRRRHHCNLLMQSPIALEATRSQMFILEHTIKWEGAGRASHAIHLSLYGHEITYDISPECKLSSSIKQSFPIKQPHSPSLEGDSQGSFESILSVQDRQSPPPDTYRERRGRAML